MITTEQNEAAGQPCPKTVGDRFCFGSYSQTAEGGKQPILWQVLDTKDTHVLALSVNALEMIPYHEACEDITWENCTLRKWLNQDFLTGAFSAEEQSRILTTELDNPDSTYYLNFENAVGGSDTVDKIFVLSKSEAECYMPVGDETRVCRFTPYTEKKDTRALGCTWWLRTPGSSRSKAVSVSPAGSIFGPGRTVDSPVISVRPAMWIELA